MEKDIKDSIKARLWDFKYTPFLSSYIFAWLYWNSKLILIFISKDLNVEKKIEMLSWHDVNYMTPLYCALAYVFVYPFVNAIFYAVTLFYKAVMNKIQQRIQDKTPLPQERANEIIKKNIELELEYSKLLESIEKMKLDYTNKTTELISQYTQKENSLNESIQEKENIIDNTIKEAVNSAIQKFQNENEQLAKELNTARSTIIEQYNKIKSSEHELNQIKESTNEITINHTSVNANSLIQRALKNSQNSSDKTLQELTEDQIKILSAFFENDTTMLKSSIKDYVFKKYSLSKVFADSRIQELEIIGYIVKIQNSSAYSLSAQGRNVIEKLFV